MNQDNIDIQEVLQEKEQKKKDEKYNAYVIYWKHMRLEDLFVS